MVFIAAALVQSDDRRPPPRTKITRIGRAERRRRLEPVREPGGNVATRLSVRFFFFFFL